MNIGHVMKVVYSSRAKTSVGVSIGHANPWLDHAKLYSYKLSEAFRSWINLRITDIVKSFIKFTFLEK